MARPINVHIKLLCRSMPPKIMAREGAVSAQSLLVYILCFRRRWLSPPPPPPPPPPVKGGGLCRIHLVFHGQLQHRMIIPHSSSLWMWSQSMRNGMHILFRSIHSDPCYYHARRWAIVPLP